MSLMMVMKLQKMLIVMATDGESINWNENPSLDGNANTTLEAN
jgi:hypothetical protein